MPSIINFFEELGKISLFFFQTIRHIPSNLKKPKALITSIYEIGTTSVFIVMLTGFFSGMVFTLEIGDALESLIVGTSQFIGGALSVSVIKEIGPILTSLVVVSKVCSSVTAKIGTMRVTEQIDALITFSVNPISYLVTPQVLGAIISLPILGFIFDIAFLVGGWLIVISSLNSDTQTYIQMAQLPLSARFIYESVIKMSIIGAVILSISSFYGFYASNGAEGVGQATIKSVVISSFMVILLDYLVGTFFILIR